MPELPEVETIRRQLAECALGRTVQRVRCLRPDMIVNATGKKLQEAASGSRITEIARRGKVLILRFSSDQSLIVHFRMTGMLCLVRQPCDMPSHPRTVFELDGGISLVHADVRRLGTLELVETKREQHARTLQNIGRDALENAPCADELSEMLSRRTCAIKQFLLNQKTMSGIGNIYASEVLHLSRIHPQTPCCDVSANQAEALLEAIDRILREAIAARGTTIRDYQTSDGEPGGFQDSLRVYGREDEPCLCGDCDGLIQRIVQANRSTYYCPCCQSAPQE